MLALKLLWRNWRGGEVKILTGALLLAVAVVTTIGVFSERLEQALVKESRHFLGADRVLRSASPTPDEWRQTAGEYGLRQARTTLFSSMVYAGDNMHLASVKAVTAGYPLLGKLEISVKPFATDAGDIVTAAGVPAPGEAWVDSRLLPLLKIELGEAVFVGEKQLTVTQVVIREPDRGDSFSMLGARLLMNAADLDATGVIQPGSRVRYHWLLAGKEAQLQGFLAWLEPRLSEHEKLLDLGSAQRGLSRSLDTGKRFLLLAGVVGVMLAGVAIAIAAQRFAARHLDPVALMKSLGAGTWQIRRLYSLQLLALALIASLAGVAVGEVFQRLVATALAALFPVVLAPAPASAYLIGIVTGLVCVIFFALPPLWHLPRVPPLKVLRRDLEVTPVRSWLRGGLGVSAVLILIGFYSRDGQLTASVALGLGAVIAVAGGLALALLKVGRRLGSRAGSVFRLALANLQRRRGQSLTQILVFAVALMLLMTLIIVRTTLIDDWRTQLPPQAPNHFLVNIAPSEVEPLEQLMREKGLAASEIYPMIRGRLTHINGALPSEAQRQHPGVFEREANLSWAEDLGADNKVLSGVWWDQWPRNRVGVSVESGVAERVGLKVGDRLSFSIGGMMLEAEIASIRSLEWDSMRPNFFFLFSPGALEGFSPMYITSVYLPADKKLFINELLQEYPTILVIEMDRVIEQIRSLVTQVSGAVELVLWLVLAAGLFVLFAAVNASIDSRIQEAGLLRALGSRRQLVMGSLWLEFSALGLFAGILAVVGAEALLSGLQYWVLNIPLQPHLAFWVLGPVVGAFIVGGLGVLSCRQVVTVSPAVVLRELG